MEEHSEDGNGDCLKVEILVDNSDVVREEDEQPQDNNASTETVQTQLVEESEEIIDELDVSKEDDALAESVIEREPIGESNPYEETKEANEVEEIDWVADEIEEQCSLTSASENVDHRSADVFHQSEAGDEEVVSEETHCEEGGKMASDFAEAPQPSEIPVDSLLAVDEKLSEFAEPDALATIVEEDSIGIVNGGVHQAGEPVEELKDAITSHVHGALEEDNVEEREIEACRVDDLKTEFDQSQTCNEIGDRVSVNEVIASNLIASGELGKPQDSIFGNEKENIVNKSVEYFQNSQKETEIVKESETNNLNELVSSPRASWRNCCGILDVLMKSKT